MSINNTGIRLHCVDRQGVTVAALSDAILQSVRWELNGAGFIKYLLSQDSDQISYPEENVNEIQLWIKRDGVEKLMHWGFHHQTTDTFASAEFTCPGLLDYMKSRYITNTSLSFVYDADHAPIGNGVDQELIAGQVWAAKSAYLNIGVGAFDHSTPRLRFYGVFSHQNILDDILSEFPHLADAEGFPTGFDFDIDISSPPVRNFMAYHQGKGSLRDDLVLELGNNLTNFSRSVRGEQQGTTVYVTGGSNGDIKFENFATAPQEILDKYGEWDQIKTRSNEQDIGVLGELAQRYENQLETPPFDLTVTAIETDAMPLIGVIETGDQIPVKISRGRVQIDDVRRITAIEWKPGPGNLNIELSPINQIVEL